MHSAEKYGFTIADKDQFRQMLLINSFRGIHSTGIAGVKLDEGDASIIKTIGSPYNLYANEHSDEFFKRFMAKFSTVIGHGRFATRGGIDAINAHPYKEGHIVLAHNGTINNFHTLKDHKKHKEIEVDSHLIAKLFEDEGAVNVLPRLQGAFVFAWIDLNERTFNIAKNSLRPLFGCKLKGRDTLMFASEEDTLTWNSSRNSVVLDDLWEVETNNIYSFKFGSIVPEVTPFEEYKFPVYKNVSYGYGNWNEREVNEDWRDTYGDNLSRKDKKKLEKQSRQFQMVEAKTNQMELLSIIQNSIKLEKDKKITIDITNFNKMPSTEYMHVRGVSADFPQARFVCTCPCKLFDDAAGEFAESLTGYITSIFKLAIPEFGKVYSIHLSNPKFHMNDQEIADDENRVKIYDTQHQEQSITIFRLKEIAASGCGWCMSTLTDKDLSEPKDLLIQDTTDTIQEIICPHCADGYLDALTQPLQ